MQYEIKHTMKAFLKVNHCVLLCNMNVQLQYRPSIEVLLKKNGLACGDRPCPLLCRFSGPVRTHIENVTLQIINILPFSVKHHTVAKGLQSSVAAHTRCVRLHMIIREWMTVDSSSDNSLMSSFLRASVKPSLKSLCVQLKCDSSPSRKLKSPSLSQGHL